MFSDSKTDKYDPYRVTEAGLNVPHVPTDE